MIYFLLPRLSIHTYKHIEYTKMATDTDPPGPFISNSLAFYLYDIKERICEYNNDWDIYKKYTNPYEYIHSLIPQRKKCIAKYKPLSRSFFKMVEIASFFNLFEPISQKSVSKYTGTPLYSAVLLRTNNAPIQTFHLAEGPGGFIEAIAYLRKCPEDSYTGMTILSDDNDANIPAWKKSTQFLRENPNVFIETGIDKTGNLLSFENFQYCSKKYKSSMDIITGDGGFDFSVDFNKQERNIANLIFAQVVFALAMQKYRGSFILKIFDSFMEHTVDILAILSSFYEQVYITKPHTSRYANSEKYIVCRGFLHQDNAEFLPYLNAAFQGMIGIDNIGHSPSRFLNIELSYMFLTKVEEYNAIFGQQQIENIHYTLSLIENKYKNDKIETLTKVNIQKCSQWCLKHNIPYHIIPVNTNMFLQNETSDTVVSGYNKQSCFR